MILFFNFRFNKDMNVTFEGRSIDRQKSPRDEDNCDTAEDRIENVNGNICGSVLGSSLLTQNEQNNYYQIANTVMPSQHDSTQSSQMESTFPPTNQSSISPTTQSQNFDIQMNQNEPFFSVSDSGNSMPWPVISDDQSSLITHASNQSASPSSDQSILSPNFFPDLGPEFDLNDVIGTNRTLMSSNEFQADAIPIRQNQVNNSMGTFLWILFILLSFYRIIHKL